MDLQMFESVPVQIEAYQLLPEEGTAFKDREDRARQIVAWVLGNDGEIEEFDGDSFVIKTLEGDMHAAPGWWVVKGTEGEFYPVKDSVFQRKYKRIV